MSVKCSTWAWGLAISNSSRKLVLLALADRANDDGECWLGMASLEAKCSMSRRTVIRALADLEAAGLIGDSDWLALVGQLNAEPSQERAA